MVLHDVCMSQFHALALLSGTLVSFGYTTVSHDGASGSLNTLVPIAVSHNDQCCRVFCMLHLHDGAAGSLNTLVLTAVSHDDAAGCFVSCSFIGWCCFWIHWYSLDTLQFHTVVLQAL